MFSDEYRKITINAEINNSSIHIYSDKHYLLINIYSDTSYESLDTFRLIRDFLVKYTTLEISCLEHIDDTICMYIDDGDFEITSGTNDEYLGLDGGDLSMDFDNERLHDSILEFNNSLFI